MSIYASTSKEHPPHYKQLEISSVERAICPIAESTMITSNRLKMACFKGKIGEGVVQYWPPNKVVLTFGGYYLCANFGKKLIKKCHCDSEHRWTDTQTQTGFIIRPMLYAIAMMKKKCRLELQTRPSVQNVSDVCLKHICLLNTFSAFSTLGVLDDNRSI